MGIIPLKVYEFLAAVLLLLGVGTWTGYHFTREHYQVLEAKEQRASDAALAAAQSTIIALQKDRAARLAKEEADDALRAKTDADFRGTVDDRMRGLTGALRACAVSSAVGSAGGGKGSAPGAGGAGALQPGAAGLDESLARFSQATDRLVAACQHDSRQVTAIQEVAPSVGR